MVKHARGGGEANRRVPANYVINGYKGADRLGQGQSRPVQAIIELRVSPKRDCGFDELQPASPAL